MDNQRGKGSEDLTNSKRICLRKAAMYEYDVVVLGKEQELKQITYKLL